MSVELISECVRLAGGQVALVEKMKPLLPVRLANSFKQGHISNWICQPRKGPVPPGEYVQAMVGAVEGLVKPHELRPDLYPVPCDPAA